MRSKRPEFDPMATELARCYDFVGVIEATNLPEWNTAPNDEPTTDLLPVSLPKLPVDWLLAGIACKGDRTEPDFADIEMGMETRLFVRVRERNGLLLYASDNGIEVVIRVFLKGQGYVPLAKQYPEETSVSTDSR